MNQSIYFTDNARHAAHQLLGGEFGFRLRQITNITDQDGCLKIDYDPAAARMRLSGGERVLLSFLESMTSPIGGEFTISHLQNLDDTTWDLVIAALFIYRGRALAVTS